MKNEIKSPRLGFLACNGSSAKANAFGVRPTLERIYLGRRFKNDTERLEKLFEMYTKMTAGKDTGKKQNPSVKKGSA